MSIPSTSDFESDREYVDELHGYGNAVASKRQIHSQNHNSTCFKYCKKGTRKCRFSTTSADVNELGIPHLYRDNEWINPYNNPCIAAANQDLSFLATRVHWSTYYITNYATKDEASTYQMVMTAAMMLEQARQASNPSDAERIALEKGMRNFALRVFNRMSHDKEASSLPQLPTYYTHSRNYIALSSTPASSFCSALR
jgi:hypothetical protein